MSCFSFQNSIAVIEILSALPITDNFWRTEQKKFNSVSTLVSTLFLISGIDVVLYSENFPLALFFIWWFKIELLGWKVEWGNRTHGHHIQLEFFYREKVKNSRFLWEGKKVTILARHQWSLSVKYDNWAWKGIKYIFKASIMEGEGSKLKCKENPPKANWCARVISSALMNCL